MLKASWRTHFRKFTQEIKCLECSIEKIQSRPFVIPGYEIP